MVKLALTDLLPGFPDRRASSARTRYLSRQSGERAPPASPTSSTKTCRSRGAAVVSKLLRKQSARFHFAPAYGPSGGPPGSGCSPYQQLLSSQSSPSYSAMTTSSSESSDASETPSS